MPSPNFALGKSFVSASDDETRAIGEQIAALLPATAVVSLEGNLGAGKTTLVQGIAAGRSAAPYQDVSSPTFALIHEYGDPVSIYHVDLYRLETEREAARLGLEELFDRPGLVIVEWGERFPKLLPPSRWLVRLSLLAGDERRIELFAPTPKTDPVP